MPLFVFGMPCKVCGLSDRGALYVPGQREGLNQWDDPGYSLFSPDKIRWRVLYGGGEAAYNDR